MATKKFIIEVEEGETDCSQCPFAQCWSKCTIDCNYVDLATMKIKEYNDINEGKALLYAVEKTAERTKREMIEKAADWIEHMVIDYLQGDVTHIFTYEMISDFRKAMQDESK